MSKIPLIVLIAALTVLVLLVYCLLREEPITQSGAPHPQHAEMHRGGDSERHAELKVIGTIHGGFHIIILTLLMAMGIKKKSQAFGGVLIAGAAYLAVFLLLTLAYFAGSSDRVFAMGLSLPALTLMFGMWIVPSLFLILYVLNFKNWIYSDRDEEQFEALLQASKLSSVPEEENNGS